MKWIGLLVIAVLCASLLGGSGGSFVPSSAAAADSVQKAAAMRLDHFLCHPRLFETFWRLIQEDKPARHRTGTDSPAWLKAKSDTRAYLTQEGVEVPDEITVAFLYSIPAGSKSGIYCIEACIGPREQHCASCAHPEKTGCFMVRHCYPSSSL